MLVIHVACLDAAECVLRAVDLPGDLSDDVHVAVLEEFGEVEQDREEDHEGEAHIGLLLKEDQIKYFKKLCKWSEFK